MKVLNLPYAGFVLSWAFYSETDKQYESYLQHQQVDENILKEIFNILTICKKNELLFPEYILNDKGEKIAFNGTETDTIVEQIQQMLVGQEITFEIEKIGGYGYVYLPGGEKARQENLIAIESIRFFESNINITTSKSVWVPISIDTTYEFSLQVELATLNGHRLENCLKEIAIALHKEVSPQENEVNKENPIWQAGFRLYVNPEIIEREVQNKNSGILFDLENFLYKKSLR